ncbi:MAG TPA: ABC transporter ATP-binding protein [Thermoanaerobaculia bacterium]|nr:ABC transporter ATP-binding protein [Thermoanaerobaculia bacterium]
MEPAVRARGLTKHYAVYRRPADRLVEILTRRSRHATFPALTDVSFDIEPGETIGVIGQNGAGKSTLLKLLCGVTKPTAGTLEARGPIASILELGTGFHPEFTGRDNAALNAAILGLSAEEVKRALPAIIEFSELGSFIDQPVKTYSSGMYMRLAFSVAVNVDPDILVIDEALAVGDGHFQKKCIDRIREFQQRKKTILFCSHALYYVTSICSRTLWLDQGRVMQFGPSVEVVHRYERFLLERDRAHPATETPVESRSTPARIASLEVAGPAGEKRTEFRRGDDVLVRAKIVAENPAQPIHVIIGVNRSADDFQCFAVGTHWDGLPPLSGRTEYDLVLRLADMPLQGGDYSVIAYVGDEHAMTPFDRRDLAPGFTIATDRFDVGLFAVRHRWESLGFTADAVRPAAGR